MTGSAQSVVKAPAQLSRMLSAVGYVAGAVSLFVSAMSPQSPFVSRHAQLAMTLHLLRLVISLGVMVAWGTYSAGESDVSMADLALQFGMLLLTGVPWFSALPSDLNALLVAPLVIFWLLSIGGMIIAMTGRSADFTAFVSAQWPDEQPQARDTGASIRDEREVARELRDRRLERMWRASRVAADERVRSTQLSDIDSMVQSVLGRLDHLNHMLSVGEVSLSRFNLLHNELIEYLEQLRGVQAQMRVRRAHGHSEPPTMPTPPPSLAGIGEIRALTLGVIDRSGVPVATFGYFRIDESLITGMLSVLDSLTEEMFGSRVSKTHLADGEVVYFARGALTVAFVRFEDEPSPLQIGELQRFVDEFEAVNKAVLVRLPVDPADLADVDLPFDFVRAEEATSMVQEQF